MKSLNDSGGDRFPGMDMKLLACIATNIVLDGIVDRYGPEYLDSDIVTTSNQAHNRDGYSARNATIKFHDAVKSEILVVTSPN